MSQEDIEKILLKNRDKFLLTFEIVEQIQNKQEINKANLVNRLKKMREHNMVIFVKITKNNLNTITTEINRDLDDLNLTTKTLNNGIYAYKCKI